MRARLTPVRTGLCFAVVFSTGLATTRAAEPTVAPLLPDQVSSNLSETSSSYSIAIAKDGRAALRAVQLMAPDTVSEWLCALGSYGAKPSGSWSQHSSKSMTWTVAGCRVEVREAFDSVAQLDLYLRHARSGSVRQDGCRFALALALPYDASNDATRIQVAVQMPGVTTATPGAAKLAGYADALVWQYARTRGQPVSIPVVVSGSLSPTSKECLAVASVGPKSQPTTCSAACRVMYGKAENTRADDFLERDGECNAEDGLEAAGCVLGNAVNDTLRGNLNRSQLDQCLALCAQ